MSTTLQPSSATPRPVMETVEVVVGSLRTPGKRVLEGVNWEVARGDFWSVGGLLGSGKTDFLHMLAGILPPLRGTYRLLGREWALDYSPAELAERLRVGLVFEGGQLLSHISLAQNVALPIQYHRNCRWDDCRERVGDLMRFAGMEHLAERLPGEVSRNWCQRAGLARALALHPEILLLDNPLSGLDPGHVRWWQERLGELAAGHPIRQGPPLTLVVTTNDLHPWKRVARQFAILKDRRLTTLPRGRGQDEVVEALQQELFEPKPEPL